MKAVDIFLPVLLALMLWQGRAGKNPDYLGKDCTQSMRGWLALTVVLHHLACRAYEGTAFKAFAMVGYLTVAGFFFLSGYGLMSRQMEDGAGYSKSIFYKKLPSLAGRYAFFTLLYVILWRAMGYRCTLKYVLTSLYTGSPVALNSWYILTLLLLYICFGLAFGVLKNRYKTALSVVVLLQLVYIILMKGLGYEYHWYISSPAFSLGIGWRLFKGEIDKAAEKHWGVLFTIAFIVFAGTYCLTFFTVGSNLGVPGLGLLSRMVSAMAVLPVILLLAMRIRIDNPALRFIGSISLELYLIHGLVYTALRSKWIYISNSFLWVLLSIILSLGLAWLLHRLTELPAHLAGVKNGNNT